MHIKNYLLLLILFLIIPNAFAQRAVIIPGTRPGTDSGLVSFFAGDTIRLRISKDHSAYCRYRAGTTVDWTLSSTIDCVSGTCPTGRLVGDADGPIDNSPEANDAISFIANDNNSDGLFPENNVYTITVEGLSPSPSNIIAECFNTTLFGNFNTVAAANPYNFLEISNDSNIEINARIVITKYDGTELSRINIAIPKAQQRDISIHDISGALNTFGRITVAHDGSLNGLRAKLTKYTNSFAITASDKFETRVNEQ